MKQETSKYLSITDVAKETGLSEAFLREAIFHRRIEYAELGRRVMIRRSDVDAWLQSATMPERTFPYLEIPMPPSAAFPNGVTRYRPVLRTSIKHNGKAIPCYSLLDTGADACMFPLDFALALGVVSESDAHDSLATGAGVDDLPVSYRRVTMEIAAIGEWSVYAGFNVALNRVKGGVLGHDGFFDHARVRFDLANRQFHIERC
jgi:excisionase family DNA binding protein